MAVGFEAMALMVKNRKYAEAAEAMFDDLVAPSGKVKPGGKAALVAEIKARLEDEHKKQLKAGLYSASQKEMAVEASGQTVTWLREKLGIEKETNTLAWRLGI